MKCMPIPAYYFFNKPFLVYMKKRGAKHPFFVMWVDNAELLEKLDKDRNVQRYSPRKAKSNFSQTNKERLKRLINQGKVIPKVLESLSKVDLDKFVYPVDIMNSIRANRLAWENLKVF